MDCHDIALLVIGNGRLDYLHDTVDAALEHLPEFGAYLMVDDSGDATVRRELERHYPDFLLSSHPENWGMARAVQDGFQMVLDETDCEYVFWLEEDFTILRPPPINGAIAALAQLPHLAQVLFQRQPLNEQEQAAGSVIGAMGLTQAVHVMGEGLLHLQRHIFSLNPCVIPRHILERGWPTDNEAGMTSKLIEDGYWFGVWDGQYVEHIGVGRGKKWQL